MTLKDLFGNDLPEDEDDDLQANQVGNAQTAATIKLRDYQIRDIARIDASSCAVYVLPTGGGKTVIFAHLIKQIVERGESVLIIAHRFEIIKQISKALVFLGIDHGIIKAGLTLDLKHKVQIASIQTLSRRVASGKMNVPKADVVIIDECQHIRAATWMDVIAANPLARLYGFTATPCRGDGRGLGFVFREMIVGPTVKELQDHPEKYLVKVKYYVPSIPDLKGIQTAQGDYVVSQLAGRMNRAQLVGDILTQWFRLGENRRTIIFAVDRNHGAAIREEFVKGGVKAEYLDGNTPRKEREEILARLASGDTRVVVNVGVLTEGYDNPAVSCIVLARPTKQLGLYLQMAGRGLRPDEDSNKQDLILIDHSGAVYRHGLLEDPIEWTLDIDSKATNKNHAARAAQHGSSDPFIECTQCGATRERGEACGNCGFKPGPRPDPIIAKDADLVEYGKRPVPYSDADEVRWFRELLALRNEKNEQRVLYGKDPLKPAWSAAKHKEKFGHWPPYSWTKSLSPADDVSAEVRSWVRSRDIAYSKGKGRGNG